MSPRVLDIPEMALVVLVGASGSGKSTFAARHFKPTEIISSDACRGIVSDDTNDQGATEDAFALVHFIAQTRLKRGKLAVIDATNVRPEDRAHLVRIAREQHCLPVAIVLNVHESLCRERNAGRDDRDIPEHALRRHCQLARKSIRSLKREGFRRLHVLDGPEEVEAVEVRREKLWNDRKEAKGPFDLIGDIHGCFDELHTLLDELGYAMQREETDAGPKWRVTPPEGRTAVFVGDLVDRGPKSPEVVRLVMDMIEADQAICVAGNHEAKLLRKLDGRNVKLTHGLAETLQQLEDESEAFVERTRQFLRGLVSHYVLDDGRLVVAHAGLKESMHGRASGRVRSFAMFGDTTGETDAYGLPVRYPWAEEYRGRAMVVYGHTPVPEPEWLNRTVNIDTGCVFGGQLTALRYPEKELVSVPAQQTWYEPVRPFLPEGEAAPALSAQQLHDEVLDIGDLDGKRFVRTALHRTITVPEQNTAAALEVMSRYAVNPKWLLYLPPTMSPCETSQEPGFLERPEEAFVHFRNQGVPRVVCEEKHMGSRVVLIVCREDEIARDRFGLPEPAAGICYTRTGRRFFREPDLERALLERVRTAFGAAGLWDELKTDWVCLDAELMPWSAKAQELVRSQYAAVAAAGLSATRALEAALSEARGRGVDVSALEARGEARSRSLEKYATAYRHYCWPVAGLEDLKLAPFHLLASEGAVHFDRDHLWHMETLARAAATDPELLVATPYRIVDLVDESSQRATIDWWTELTSKGGEGMVVKPFEFITKGRKGLLQPALKVRGPEYLRIIYGPEYSNPQHLDRLRARGLGKKRSLALREFALGHEALSRFTRREPLSSTHECVLSILALESEPVDPRL